MGGSPLHRDLSDEGQDKGVYVIDLETAAWVFLSLNDRFPVFVSVTEGDELDETNKYVVRKPAFAPLSEADVQVVENFSTDNKPAELLKNFWTEVDGKNKPLLEKGLSFLT